MDDDTSQQYIRSSKPEGQYSNQRGGSQTGFVVAGAPWEQQPQQVQSQQQQRHPVVAPNTASNEEFPSFGDMGSNASSGGAPLWGPRR